MWRDDARHLRNCPSLLPVVQTADEAWLIARPVSEMGIPECE
jgi:hypothetical protein